MNFTIEAMVFEYDDDFITWFPVPFRVYLLILVMLWGFCINFSILSFYDIDVHKALQTKYKYPVSRLYTVAFSLTLFYVVMLFAHLFWTRDKTPAILLYVVSLFWLVSPFDFLYARLRRSFLNTVWSLFTLQVDRTIPFCENLMADILCSLSKAFGDFEIVICSFWTSNLQSVESCIHPILWPLLSLFPFLLRLKQCVSEYNYSQNYRHLINAFKYSLAIPVIILGAVHKNSRSIDYAAYYLWFFFISIQSLFSFMWDILMDWDLVHYRFRGNYMLIHQEFKHKWLRPTLLFRKPYFYYCAIGIDLLLRIAWGLKLYYMDMSASEVKFQRSFLDTHLFVFLLQLAEIFRRWVWITFRIENQYLQSQSVYKD